MDRIRVVEGLRAVPSVVNRMSARHWATAYLILSFAYVIFCVHQPLSMNAYAGHDDLYFVQDARSMLAGHWLGEFNQITLIKGPGFTYFLVLNNQLGLPLTLTLALVYVAACASVCAVLRRVTSLRPLTTFVIFAILLLQPAVIPNRVIRDTFYHSLFLFVVAGVASVALDGRRRGRLLRAALAGIAIGWFWITREEGPWIVPAVLGLFAVQAWRYRRARVGRLRAVAAIGVMALVASVPVLATSAVNKAEYGAFTVTDFASGPYKAAVSELDRIEAGPELPRVPVSRKALAAAYRVSPAAHELKAFLDGPGGKNWGAPTCEIYPDECGEFAGGWFGWALRDAAAAAGHYRSEIDANHFFARVADEVANACDRGVLTCRTNPIPLLPVMTRDTALQVPGAMVRAARFTTYEQLQPPAAPSVGTGAALRQAEDVLGRPLLSRTADHGFDAAASRWLRLKTDLMRVYRVLMSVLLVAGVVGFLLACALRLRRRPVSPNALLLAVFLWVLYLSRLGLIAIVDVTAAPAVNMQYLEPAFLALCLAGLVSLSALGTGLRGPDGPTDRPGAVAGPISEEEPVSASVPDVGEPSRHDAGIARP